MQTKQNTTAKILLQTQSVLLSPNDPFTLTGGKKSPVYVDCRRLIAFPQARTEIIRLAGAKLGEEVGFDVFDAVAGGETAGIAYAAWLAESLHKPMAYIRKKPKGFGLNARIEGDLQPGQNVLLVEDLATDGGSKVSFADAVRDSGAYCEHCFVVFYYGIFAHAEEVLQSAGIKLHYLATWHDIMAEARSAELMSEADLAQVQEFLDAPEAWQKKNT